MSDLLASFEYSYNDLFDALIRGEVDIDQAEKERELSLALLDCCYWQLCEMLLEEHESTPELDICCHAEIFYKRTRDQDKAIQAILPVVEDSLAAARQYLLYRWMSNRPTPHADHLCRSLIDAQEINAYAHAAMYTSMSDPELATHLAETLEDVASVDYAEMKMMLRYQLWHGNYESREYWANRALRSYPKSEIIRVKVMKIDRYIGIKRNFSVKDVLKTCRYTFFHVKGSEVCRPLPLPLTVLAGIVALGSTFRLIWHLD